MKQNEDFFTKVFEVVRQIPYGKLCTYGLIANAIGSPSGARMVGWALNKSFAATPTIPAHRVINRNGMLTGKMAFGNPFLMKELLENEGHIVIDDKVVDFNNSLWNPLNEMA